MQNTSQRPEDCVDRCVLERATAFMAGSLEYKSALQSLVDAVFSGGIEVRSMVPSDLADIDSGDDAEPDAVGAANNCSIVSAHLTARLAEEMRRMLRDLLTLGFAVVYVPDPPKHDNDNDSNDNNRRQSYVDTDHEIDEIADAANKSDVSSSEPDDTSETDLEPERPQMRVLQAVDPTQGDVLVRRDPATGRRRLLFQPRIDCVEAAPRDPGQYLVWTWTEPHLTERGWVLPVTRLMQTQARVHALEQADARLRIIAAEPGIILQRNEKKDDNIVLDMAVDAALGRHGGVSSMQLSSSVLNQLCRSGDTDVDPSCSIVLEGGVGAGAVRESVQRRAVGLPQGVTAHAAPMPPPDLFDPRGERAHFLQEIARMLGLPPDTLESHNGRVTGLGTQVLSGQVRERIRALRERIVNGVGNLLSGTHGAEDLAFVRSVLKVLERRRRARAQYFGATCELLKELEDTQRTGENMYSVIGRIEQCTAGAKRARRDLARIERRIRRGHALMDATEGSRMMYTLTFLEETRPSLDHAERLYRDGLIDEAHFYQMAGHAMPEQMRELFYGCAPPLSSDATRRIAEYRRASVGRQEPARKRARGEAEDENENGP